MPFAWRPVPGQVALIEVVGLDTCLTGVVLDAAGEAAGAEPLERLVVVDVGASPPPPDGECEVVASFFAWDALYRLSAVAVPHAEAPTLVDLRVSAVERVQRRHVGRARLGLRAVLSSFDGPGPLVSVVGETVDVGEGGCRVRTSRSFPEGCDPTVTLTLPDGAEVVVLGAVVQAQRCDGGHDYRIVFLGMDDADRKALARLVSELAPAGADAP